MNDGTFVDGSETKIVDPSTPEVNVVNVDLEFESRPINEILEEAENLDVKKVAEELLQWVEMNVENFIDNHRKFFKLDLVLDKNVKLENLRKLQDLYRAIPDSEEDQRELGAAVDCRTMLHEITAKVHQAARENKELLEKLFDRMKFYYEMQGAKDGKLLIRELEGSVDIVNFEYDAFSLGVKVTKKLRTQSGELKDEGEVKEYVIPEGFTCWIEIAFRPKERPASIF